MQTFYFIIPKTYLLGPIIPTTFLLIFSNINIEHDAKVSAFAHSYFSFKNKIEIYRKCKRCDKILIFYKSQQEKLKNRPKNKLTMNDI